MTVTLKKNKDGVNIVREGQILICPFRSPLMLPGCMANTIEIQQLPCSNNCPHFNLDVNQQMLILTCGGLTQTMKVETPPEEKKTLHLL